MDPTDRLFLLVAKERNPDVSLDALLLEIDEAIDAGADASAERVLTTAGRQLSARLLQHLIDRGATIGGLNSALHSAATAPSFENTRVLLEAGADPNALNHFKQTCLGAAQKTRSGSAQGVAESERVIALLRKHGGVTHRPDFVPLVDDDAAAALGSSKSAVTFRAHHFDSLEEIADWVKEHAIEINDVGQIDVTNIASVLVSGAEAATLPADTVMNLPFFHHGDLHVLGDLYVNSAFVVTGDLLVDGVLADGAASSYIAVAGALKAHAITTDGDVRVGGDVDALVVHGHYNDHWLQAKTVRARVLLWDDHSFQAELECDAVIDFRDYDPLVLGRLFARGLYRPSGELDVDALFRDLRAGKSVFPDEAEESSSNTGDAEVLSLEQFELWLKRFTGNQRSKLEAIKEHWTPSLRASEFGKVRALLGRSIKSPRLKEDLAAYLEELGTAQGE